jgi:hypothetical protein
MSKMLIPGIVAAVVAFSPLTAQASPDDEILLSRLSGVTELSHSGIVAVQFVEGRPIGEPRAEHAAPASAARARQEAAQYFDESMLLTLALISFALLAFFGVVLSTRRFGTRAVADAARADGWKADFANMMQADLNNLDSLLHGIPGR